MSLRKQKEINDEGLLLNKEKNILIKKILDNEEKLESRESEKSKNLEKISEVNNKLNNSNLELEKAEAELVKRKKIIKYINFEEERLFELEGIISAFDRKIDLLKEDEIKLQNILDNITNELIKLKTGKILELPRDIEEKLRQKDISIVYGMEWLKKNGYSLEKNEKLVENNPFVLKIIKYNRKK